MRVAGRPRPISFFFGGQASRAQNKWTNYARWTLFEHSLAPGSVVISSDGGHTSDGINAPRQGLPDCNASSLRPSRLLASDARSAAANPQAPLICQGHYRASEMLLHSEFVLAVRGDTLTSRRLADAVSYGAIPIFVGDEVFEMGIPFQ